MKAVFIPRANQYEFGLIESLHVEMLFDIKLMLNGSSFVRDTGLIKSDGYHRVSMIYKDFIYDVPSIHASFRANYTTGQGPWTKVEKRVRKAHFKSLKILPNGSSEDGYIVNLMDELPKKHSDYELEIVHLEKNEDALATDPFRILNDYSYVIDLHAEKLGLQESSSNQNILQMQLNAFDSWLAKGVVRSSSKLTVIHGVGEGKLRQAIHDRLKYHESVDSYKNEHHPQFGFGATEIILR